MFGQRKRSQHDFAEELQAHLALEADRLRESGMSEEEAWAAARRNLGNVAQAQERFYDAHRWLWLDSLIQDLRFGLRQLRRNPGFTAVAVITLALGIGATTAIFSVVNAVILRRLPFPAPHELVQITASGRQRTINLKEASYPDFLDWRKQNKAFTDMAAYQQTFFTLLGRSEADFVRGMSATPSLFSMLGVKPLLGRVFTWNEEGPQAAPVAMISERLWRHRFGANRALVGKTIDLNKRAFTVVGVMPSSFQFPFLSKPPGIWVPVTKDPIFGSVSGYRQVHYLRVIARLKPGVSVAAAQAQMKAILDRLANAYPKTDEGWNIQLVPLHKKLVGGVQGAMLILLGAVFFVVLIACANVANLLLARATSRQKDFAVRAALGASRGRLVRQVLSESILLSLLGGGLGLLLAFGGMGALSSLVPTAVPRIHSIGIDGWVLGFTVALSMIVGVLSGLAPALHRSECGLSEALKEGARGPSASGRRSVRGILVVSEVALAMVLLVGAGLLIRTFVGLDNVNPGFDTHQVFEAAISLARSKYKGPDQWRQFWPQLLDRVRALPGVKSAAAILVPPLSGSGLPLPVSIPGHTTPGAGELPPANYSAVTAGYFRTMKIPLLRGRLFTRGDGPSSRPVLLISEAAARRYFPGRDPIGQGMTIGFPALDKSVRYIVGIVGNVKMESLGETPSPEIYTPFVQAPFFPVMSLVIRTTGNPAALAPGVRAQLRRLDPSLPLAEVTTAGTEARQTLAQPRFHTLLLGTFGALALILAMVGIYGVISYSVSQRTHEIGIRMALGAQRGDVLKLVVEQGMSLTLTGVGIGIAAALGLTRFLAGMLYGVKPTDPLTFVAVSLILLGVALLACYIPARRAANVDPMVALRHE